MTPRLPAVLASARLVLRAWGRGQLGEALPVRFDHPSGVLRLACIEAQVHRGNAASIGLLA